MKRLILGLAVILSAATAVSAAPPAPLTTLRQIHALTNAEASQGLPVAFEATVVFYRGYEGTLFVQDSDTAVYVQYPTDAKLDSGDRIFVRGTTQSSYHPIVISNSITLLRHNDAI